MPRSGGDSFEVSTLTLSCANSSQARKQRAAPTTILCTTCIFISSKKEASYSEYVFSTPHCHRQSLLSSCQRELLEQKKNKCCREKEKPQGPPSLFFCKLKWHTVILKVNTYLQWETFCSGSSVQRISLNYGNKHRGSFIIAQTRALLHYPSFGAWNIIIYFLSIVIWAEEKEMKWN